MRMRIYPRDSIFSSKCPKTRIVSISFHFSFLKLVTCFFLEMSHLCHFQNRMGKWDISKKKYWTEIKKKRNRNWNYSNLGHFVENHLGEIRVKYRTRWRISWLAYLVVLTMEKKMEGKINFIMSHRLEETVIRMIWFQMENKSVQCIFNKCPPKSPKNKKFYFYGSFSTQFDPLNLMGIRMMVNFENRSIPKLKLSTAALAVNNI